MTHPLFKCFFKIDKLMQIPHPMPIEEVERMKRMVVLCVVWVCLMTKVD